MDAGSFALVWLGSGVGGMLRYVISFYGKQHPLWLLPWWTLLVNIVGGFVIGLCTPSLLTNKRAQLFLLTGFCGGLTTFSTFSLETVNLFRQGERTPVGWAIGNILLNNVLSILACYIGVRIGNS